MNTTFKILWFEDELLWYNMESLRINQILEKHKLTPELTRRDGSDFDIQELTSNDYDLILMDYKLAEDITGDVIVSAIRQADILTDILFYSSQEQDMLDAIRTNMPPIDGVYLTKRDYQIFTEKVERIINKIVRRSEDVVNLRGFVLDNTSDFEIRIKEILNICWQKFNEEERALLTETLKELLGRKQSRVESQVKKALDAIEPFAFANNDDYLLSISERLDIFQTVFSILIKSHGLPEMECKTDFKKYYVSKISVYRNKLGHVELGEKTIRINGDNIEINQDLHRLLRKNIFDVDSLIKKIEEHITMKM